MNVIKTRKTPADSVIIRHEEIELIVDGKSFLFTENDIKQHLSEGWMEDESAICNVDDVYLELYPKDYRAMLKLLYPFGGE